MQGNQTIKIKVNGEQKSVTYGTLISAVLPMSSPCGWHGKCGKCKVKAVGALSPVTPAEKERLTAYELENGIRLACKTQVLGYCEIEYERADGIGVMLDGSGKVAKLAPLFCDYGVAVDIGTTTIAVRLFAKTGETLAEGGTINGQAKFGADVISRVEASLRGEANALKLAVRESIDEVIERLAKGIEIDGNRIDGAVITGNTVMLSLFTGTGVEPFSHAPFKPLDLFGKTYLASELGLTSISRTATVYIPRSVSAFVGADITTAMLSVGLNDKKNAVLVDIGTNGEIAFSREGQISVCSTSAGPAFEGVGLSCGMTYGAGAIDKVSVVNGNLVARVVGGGEPKGVCGSGIIDAIAGLLTLEQIDKNGYLEEEYRFSDGVRITQKDIREIQLAKSAICAGIKTLVAKPKDKPKLYIAGGFGSKIDFVTAGKIGLIPIDRVGKIETVGNASLSGAQMLLLDRTLIGESENLAKNCDLVELATDKTFIEEYTSGMTFE